MPVLILSGFDPEIVLYSIKTVIAEFEVNGGYRHIAYDYTINNTSWRVLKLILGNTGLSNRWWGVK